MKRRLDGIHARLPATILRRCQCPSGRTLRCTVSKNPPTETNTGALLTASLRSEKSSPVLPPIQMGLPFLVSSDNGADMRAKSLMNRR
jgi:hypothetical protein